MLLMRAGAANTAGALTNCQSALFNLRASNGYKAAKKANPKPESFARTFTGRAEQDIEAAIQLLGGTP
jgi:hypothetical protein